MADDPRSRSLGRATLYLSLPFDILAGALVGYYVAKSLGFPAELGAAVGVILGTILMWVTVYREVKRAERHAETSKL
ncbi:MAG: hypothetical protein QW057_10920 [Candidatus Bathyarchaeia archaeon]